jgi:hypothetical protein
MTVERALFVRIPPDRAEGLRSLQRKADAHLRRAAKLPPGDTREVARSEALASQIEREAVAIAATDPSSAVLSENVPDLACSLISPGSRESEDHSLPADARGWLAKGSMVVFAALPHMPGETIHTSDETGPKPPATAWKASRRDNWGAQTERFESVIQRALDGGRALHAINPSNVSNRVLTQTLRKYVNASPGDQRVDVPVEYWDGSAARPFPFRAVALSNEPLPELPVLRFSLLSIRHVEMDELVDGAWFRNVRISRPRAAGLTDDDAFDLSIKQLAKIRLRGPRIIKMYQTGLQPAVTGFYRAVTHALIDHPGSVHVIPMYYVGDGFQEEKRPWQTI